MWNKFKKWLDHNTFLACAIVVCVVLVLYAVGCEPQVASLTDPAVKVNRAELQAELDTEVNKLQARIDELQTKAELKNQELDKIAEMQNKLLEIGTVVAQGGTIDPVGAGLSLLGILGIGAVADNRKKDAVIKTLKKQE